MKSDLLTGKPIKSIILFALPIMASSMLQYNYNLVDNIIVGRFVGTDALAAVGNAGAINSFVIGTALGLTSGLSNMLCRTCCLATCRHTPCCDILNKTEAV